MEANQPTPGQDTATGTDPDATFDQSGYEDKSFGQAVNQDQDTVDRLLSETGGDVDEAAARFEDESAGAPARARQQAEGDEDDEDDEHATGDAKAARNRAEDPPA